MLSSPIYHKECLTYEEQLSRGKPLPYLRKMSEKVKEFGGEVVVEIGTMRQPLNHDIDELNPHCCNDGHSTYFFGKEGFEVHSVDIDTNACYISKTSCLNFPKVRVYNQDGIGFLSLFDKKIDLLYLDAWDVGTSKYAEKHLEAFKIAEPKLSDQCVVAIDDTDVASGGKGKLITEYLDSIKEWHKIAEGRQTIYIKPLI